MLNNNSLNKNIQNYETINLHIDQKDCPLFQEDHLLFVNTITQCVF